MARREHMHPGQVPRRLSALAAAVLVLSTAPAALSDLILPDVAEALTPRNLSRTGERNEANPRFSAGGRYLSFERRDGSAQAIFVADVNDLAKPPARISSLLPTEAADPDASLLGIGARDGSFNTQLSFLPDSLGVIFTGNAGAGVYQIYRSGLDGSPRAESVTRQGREAGHPAVSPDGRWLVYVSSRDGVGKLFLRDLHSGRVRQLTHGDNIDLHPVWSPDSRALAFTSGSNDNHDVFLIRDVQAEDAASQAVTRWNFDDLRPVFSPDGRHLAFYSNFDPAGVDGQWSILVVPADGSGPVKGRPLAKHVVVRNVVKDPDMGAAWLPRGDALVYARNRKEEWNPIYVVELASGEERRIATHTRMNHDLVCSARGLLAFRAQVGSWDDIFIAQLVSLP